MLFLILLDPLIIIFCIDQKTDNFIEKISFFYSLKIKNNKVQKRTLQQKLNFLLSSKGVHDFEVSNF